MNAYRTLANDLRRRGAVASRARGRHASGLQFTTPMAALALACAVGVGILLTLTAFVIRYPTAVGHLAAGRLGALDRFAAAQMDLSEIDPAEIRAFIATRPEDRASLIEIGRYWPPPAQRRLLELSQQSRNPGETFFMMTRFAYLLRGSPARQKLAFAVADLGEEDADRLVATVDPAALVKSLASMSSEALPRIVSANTRTTPDNATRADSQQVESPAPSSTRSDAGAGSPPPTDRQTRAPSAKVPQTARRQPPGNVRAPGASLCPAGYFATVTSFRCAPATTRGSQNDR
ncbi:MAG: hypothetical protein U1E28_02130 [Beijerinckiaceae bacterium]|mgnify:FL=1